MSMIYKCDRCGRTIKSEELNSMMSLRLFDSIDGGYKYKVAGHCGVHNNVADLCWECAKAFDEFMACKSKHVVEVYDTPPAKMHEGFCKKNHLYKDSLKLFFDNPTDAHDAIEMIKECLETYCDVSIGDIYDFIGRESPNGYVDYRYGWFSKDIYEKLKYDAVPIDPQNQRLQWIIELPKPTLLNTNGDDTDGDKYFE